MNNTKRDVWLQGSHSSLQKKPKQAEIATETPKTATNDLDTIKPLTEPQIAKYSMILCKLGSISDLSNFPRLSSFCKLDWEHFEEPWKSRWTNSKTDFHSIENRNRLQQEKLIFSCDGFSWRALSHWVQWVRFALQNCLSRGNHVEFSSVSLFFSHRCTKRHYRSSDTSWQL